MNDFSKRRNLQFVLQRYRATSTRYLLRARWLYLKAALFGEPGTASDAKTWSGLSNNYGEMAARLKRQQAWEPDTSPMSTAEAAAFSHHDRISAAKEGDLLRVLKKVTVHRLTGDMRDIDLEQGAIIRVVSAEYGLYCQLEWNGEILKGNVWPENYGCLEFAGLGSPYHCYACRRPLDAPRPMPKQDDGQPPMKINSGYGITPSWRQAGEPMRGGEDG